MIIPLDAPNKPASVRDPITKRSSASQWDHVRRDTTDDGDEDDSTPPAPEEKTPYKQKTCSDCNRKFCLDLGLPDCREATEEDVVTSCFREFDPLSSFRDLVG